MPNLSSFNIIDAYNQLIREYGLSNDTFATALNVNQQDILSEIQAGSIQTDLANLVAIIYSLTLADDVDTKLTATIESLHSEFAISLETIALLSKIDISIIHQFVENPASSLISSEIKYKLSYTSVFLLFVLCKDRNRW